MEAEMGVLNHKVISRIYKKAYNSLSKYIY